MLLLAVAIIVGVVTAYFFDVDTALWAGKRTVDIWIMVGLVITILSPFLDLFRILKSVGRKLYNLFNRKKV